MDVDSRQRPAGPAPGASGQYVLPERPPNRWVIPLAVAVAVVLGVVSVPVLMSLSAGSAAPVTQTLTPTASAAPSVAEPAPVAVATVAPRTRSPRPALSLAAPPPAPKASPRPSTDPSMTGQPADPGGRSATLDPPSGPAGRVVTVSGRCLTGTDTQVVAGTTRTAAQELAGDGTFSARLQVATSAAQARVGAVVPLVAICRAKAGVTYRFDLHYRVTGVVAAPGQIPGDAGPVNAPDTAAVGDAIGVSAGGFMGAAPVIIQLRDADTGQVASSQRVLADDSGQVSASGLVLPATGTGHVQVVAAGLDPSGGQHILASVVTTG